jgi:hypothetical protein
LRGTQAAGGVQVPQHRADGLLVRPRRERRVGGRQVTPEGHHVAVVMMGDGGQFLAGRHDRGAVGGQEGAEVEFALQPVLVVAADGRGARGDLGHHRGRPQVHRDVRAVGQHRGLGAGNAKAGSDGDRGADRGIQYRLGHP